MSFEVTEVVKQQVRRFFTEPQVGAVIAELERADLPLINNNGERVHLALLIMSRGNIETFRQQLDSAKIDWRDTLVTAGLAHEDWPDALRRAGVSGFKEPSHK